MIIKDRPASQTEYGPRYYNTASMLDAANASVYADIGVKLSTKIVNSAPKAPIRKCKSAERVKSGLDIAIPF